MNAPFPAVEEPVFSDVSPAPEVAPEAVPVAVVAPRGAVERLVSLDAFRGLTMVLMVSAGLYMSVVAKSFPGNPVWKELGYQTNHAEWRGCSLWDMIQPSFMFMVGAAIPFSMASRRAKGQGFGRMFFHAVWRAVALTLLGVFLSTGGSDKQTNWAFANVLSQIGLGYVFLFLLAWVRPRWQWVAAFSILFFYWLAFALYPAPAADFDFASVNAADVKSTEWHRLEGFGAHWEKNSNFAARVDRWFLNLFPRPRVHTGNEAVYALAQWSAPAVSAIDAAAPDFFLRKVPFVGNNGGYATLNFVPALVTMLFGLMAGQLLRGGTGAGRKLLYLVAAGAVGLGVGWTLDHFNICPSVKRIWTPSWTIFSTGWACLALAFFYLTLDVAKVRFWAWPLVVVGMNSIAVYMMAQLMKPWFRETVRQHTSQDIFVNIARKFGSPVYEPMVQSGMFLVAVWLVAWWMYRRRLFLKI